jgi:hypothetical protein
MLGNFSYEQLPNLISRLSYFPAHGVARQIIILAAPPKVSIKISNIEVTKTTKVQKGEDEKK